MDYIRIWWKAARPFSLTAALIPTMLGSVLAYKDGHFDPLICIIVIAAGLVMQAGVNQINDYFEYIHGMLPGKNPDYDRVGIERNTLEFYLFVSGVILIFLTVPAGLYIVAKRGIPFLIIGIIGVIGAYGYTGKPIVYKERGLGVILVFFLMGVLMVYGSYYAVSGIHSAEVFYLSLPVSFLVSELLISNELRDYEEDSKNNIHTLTVIIGKDKSRTLYLIVPIVVYILTVVYIFIGFLPLWSLITLATIPYYLKNVRLSRGSKTDLRILVPRSANLHLFYGLLLVLSILLKIS